MVQRRRRRDTLTAGGGRGVRQACTGGRVTLQRPRGWLVVVAAGRRYRWGSGGPARVLCGGRAGLIGCGPGMAHSRVVRARELEH